jgi:hypothetical protein
MALVLGVCFAGFATRLIWVTTGASSVSGALVAHEDKVIEPIVKTAL